MLRKIVSSGDCYIFQLEIDRVQGWCEANKLGLNVKKCAIMSITRKPESSRLEYQYRIGEDMVPRVQSKRDLGVIIDSKLSFTEHINVMTNGYAT